MLQGDHSHGTIRNTLNNQKANMATKGMMQLPATNTTSKSLTHGVLFVDQFNADHKYQERNKQANFIYRRSVHLQT